MLIQKLQALFHPEQYHGWGKTKRYFEGWYYKIINASEDKAFAIIPGIAMDEKGEKQAFIQVLDGKKLTAEYFKFDAIEFKIKSGKIELELEDNLFTQERVQLNLPGFKGELKFEDQVPWPNKWYSPGIMGPFAFVPFMECYHGILSMDHKIEGKLKIYDEEVSFNGGRGYMEKDWGQSFPSAYFWMQSNHFSKPGVSLKVSVAKIPWMRSSFVGFIAGFWWEGKLIQFTTYNSSHLRKSYADADKVEVTMENPAYRLEIFAHRKAATELASPIHGFMDGRISESMTSEIEVKLFDKKTQNLVFEDTGRNAGLEVAGKIEEIFVI